MLEYLCSCIGLITTKDVASERLLWALHQRVAVPQSTARQ